MSLAMMVTQIVGMKPNRRVKDDKVYYCPQCKTGVREFVGESARRYSFCKACISEHNKRRYRK